MIKFILLIFILIIREHSFSDECKFGEFNLEELDHTYSNPTIYDTHIGLVKNFIIENIQDIECTSRYFDIQKNETTVSLFTSNEFEKYEENEISDTHSIDIVFECKNNPEETHQIKFSQKIANKNNHAPIFNNKLYIFKIGSALPKDFDLTNILPIQVKDIDLGQSFMSFNVDSDDIRSTHKSYENKLFNAAIVTNRKISPPFHQHYTITALDSMFDGLNASASIEIHLEVPKEEFEFINSIYIGNIDGRIITLEEQIKLKNGCDGDMEFKFYTEYENYFKAKVNPTTNSIEIILDRELPEVRRSSSKDIRFDFEAQWHGLKTTTTIILTSDKDILQICLIEGIDLKNDYRNPNTIPDTHTGVTQSFSKMVHVDNINCAGSKYLECRFDKVRQQLEILTTKEFEEFEAAEDFGSIRMNMTIECPNRTYDIGYTQWIEDINNHEPAFTKENYDFILYNGLRHKFKLNEILPIVAEDLDVDTQFLYFSMDENDYFELPTYEFVKNKQVKPTLITKQAVYPPFDEKFTIFVRDSREPFGEQQATLHLKLIPNYDQLNFTQTNYTGYVENGKIVIESLQLRNGFDLETTFSIVDHENGPPVEIMSYTVNNSIALMVNQSDEQLQMKIGDIVEIEAFWQGLKTSTYVRIDSKPQHDGEDAAVNEIVRYVKIMAIVQIVTMGILEAAFIGLILFVLYKWCYKRVKRTTV